MLKKHIFIVISLFIGFGASAQMSVNDVLRQIEENNATISAKRELYKAQVIEERVGNTLSDPEVEFIALGNKDVDFGRAFELSVIQEFDFPSVYSNRNKLAKIRAEKYGYEYDAQRQQILLDAYSTCIEISALKGHTVFLKKILEIAEKLKNIAIAGSNKGDMTIIDGNRANLEYISAKNDYQLNRVEYQAALEKLQNLNGGIPIDFDGFTIEEIPPLPPVEQMQDLYMNHSPEILALLSENRASMRDVKLSRSLSLPKFGLGYKQDKGPGEKAMHGLIVSASIPLYGNRHNVKRAKAQATVAEAEIRRGQIDIASTIAKLYQKANIVLETIEEYKSIANGDTMIYLLKALEEGEISISEFYSEELPYHKISQEIIDLYREYHHIYAEINMINL